MKQNNNNLSFNADIYYNYSPYLPFAFEIQAGKLSGGNFVTDPSHRFFTSNFVTASLHGDLQLGEITDFDNRWLMQRLKGFYLGTGIGLMMNKVKNLRDDVVDIGHVFPGEDNSITLLVPLRFGYDFKVYNMYDENFMNIYIGYVHNLTFAEGMDGYNDPPTKFKNNAQDMFRQFTIGVKFNFGNSVSYNKSIR